MVIMGLFEYRLNIFLVGGVQGAVLSLRHKFRAQGGPLFFWPFCKRAIRIVILAQRFGDCGLIHGTKVCSTFVLFKHLCRILTVLDQFLLHTIDTARLYILETKLLSLRS